MPVVESLHPTVALAIAVLASIGLLVVSVRFAAYRVRHQFTGEDIKRERQAAARHSRSVMAGRSAEQLVALLPEFCDRFDTEDARFLGAPVDYVVFDGLCAGELDEVVLLEVKTGGSALNARERQVKRAVEEGRVRYELLRL